VTVRGKRPGAALSYGHPDMPRVTLDLFYCLPWIACLHGRSEAEVAVEARYKKYR